MIIAEAAWQEEVDAVGLSILSVYPTLLPRIVLNRCAIAWTMC